MKPYCEIIVKDILPVLRSAIARELADTYKMNQSQIARSLGVSQPAISQYLRSLRGNGKHIFENKAVDDEIKRLCQRINSEKLPTDQLIVEICSICKVITGSQLLCPMHKSAYKLDNCTMCLKHSTS